MTYDVFVQGLGLVASVLGISSFFFKSDEYFRLLILSAESVFLVHFLLLGAYAGAAVAGINATRTFLSMKGFKSNKVLIFFLVIYVIAAILIYESVIDLLPMLSGAVATIGLFKFSGIKLRTAFLFSEFAWLVYGLIVKSVGGVIASIFALGANLQMIYRLCRDKKEVGGSCDL